MTYRFSAKGISQKDSHALIDLINGGMDKLGMPWDAGWPEEVVYPVIEQAQIDIGYCLDGKEKIPAGGCAGESFCTDFNVAVQQTIKRI